MLALALLGCAPKRLVVDTIADVDVYAASRPVPGEYDAWAPVRLQECEATDHDVHVEDAIRTATTGHDALVEVVVQRRTRTEYVYWANSWGRPTSELFLVSETVCYDVSGIPIDFRDEGSESLAVAPPAPRAPVIPTSATLSGTVLVPPKPVPAPIAPVLQPPAP